MKGIKSSIIFFSLLASFCMLFAEDKSSSVFDQAIVSENIMLKELKSFLLEKSEEVNRIYAEDENEEALLTLKDEIKELKDKIFDLELNIRKQFDGESSSSVDESYAFWNQGETTLSQLILEYGSSDYLYVVPPELSGLKISLFSSIPIPRSSWPEMIEAVLYNNGIGVNKINNFLRQLYILKQDLSNVEVIASERQQIDHLPDHSLVFFVFSPSIDKVKPTHSFFERYADPKQSNVQIVGNKVIIVSAKKNIIRLFQLYDAIWGADNDKVVKVIKTSKLSTLDIEKVIKSFFGEQPTKARTPFFQSKIDEIIVLPLPDNTSIVLVGDKQIVHQAEQLINDLENQVDDPGEMTIFWYACKHSDPQDIADILTKVYTSMSSSSLEEKSMGEGTSSTEINQEITCKSGDCERLNIYNPVNPIAPVKVEPGRKEETEKQKSNSNNFVVDGRTGSILMTVRKDDLEKIKKILKKIDVAKKMAQIDVLLVERKLRDRKQTGINILKIGTNDVENKQNSVSFDTNPNALKRGILNFIFQKPKGNFPSFDFALSFLMSQEDLKINANPSVLAVNQTEAKISIVEEISISNGAVQANCSTGWNVEKSYTRSQFGITIVMTPTIHLPDPEKPEDKGFVTLKTDVNFDTAQLSENNDRPPVTKRQIQNEVRIADGETIILGGLRKKSQEDVREKIPFLGDLPGVGKLFGTTKLTDHSTEMFIFITPRIIKDPIEDLRVERQNYLSKRPGDIPEFLAKIERAKNCERKRLFENSLKVLFEKQCN